MEQEDPSSRRAKWAMKLAKYHFQITHRPGKNMEHADFLSRMNQLRAEDRTGVKYVLVVIYNDKGVYLSIRYGQVMEGLLQTPCGKVEPQETSIQAAQREVEEETGLTNLDLK